MKKIVLITVFLLVPFTTFAIDTMTDADLDETIAQAGVTVILEDVSITQSATSTAWGDTEGAVTSWVVMNAEETTSKQVIDGSVTIDVMSGSELNTALESITDDLSEAAVVIGLDLDIVATDGTTQTIMLNTTAKASDNPISATTGTSTLGTLYQSAADQQISGTIAIMAH